MKIISTICSRYKNETSELLPAGDRYVGSHIAQVKAVAHDLKIPFYFLSGKYGLISEDTKIPYYDYYLEDDAVDALVRVVASQIHEEKISEIEFYSEDKVSWTPYRRVIEIAARQSDIILRNHLIS